MRLSRLVLWALLAAAVPMVRAEDLDPAARYQAVLVAMKTPAATGAMVAEFAPRSPGEASGLLPGDIITSYADLPIQDEADLRGAVTEMLARKPDTETDVLDTRLPVVVRRGAEEVKLTVPRGPLGLTILSAKAGQALPLNPPPTPRGEVPLAWNALVSAAGDTASSPSADSWMRLYQQRRFIAAEQTTVRAVEDRWEISVLTQMAGADGFPGTQRCTVQLTVGDNVQTPGFVLSEFAYEGEGIRARAERKGLTLRGSLIRPVRGQEREEAVTLPTLLNGVPVYALPVIAAALPQKADVVLPVAVVSEIDLRTRQGYVLRTQGQVPVKLGKENTSAWGVELLHFAKPEMTFWFNDRRELLKADYGSGLVAERARDRAAAMAGLQPSSSSQENGGK